MTTMDKLVGSNIQKIRKQRGFTQEAVAQYAAVDQTTISKIESGQRSVNVLLLEKLGNLFFCSIDDFLIDPNEAFSSSKKAIAFRSADLDGADLQAIAAIGQIVRNLEEMTLLEEEVNVR